MAFFDEFEVLSTEDRTFCEFGGALLDRHEASALTHSLPGEYVDVERDLPPADSASATLGHPFICWHPKRSFYAFSTPLAVIVADLNGDSLSLPCQGAVAGSWRTVGPLQLAVALGHSVMLFWFSAETLDPKPLPLLKHFRRRTDWIDCGQPGLGFAGFYSMTLKVHANCVQFSSDGRQLLLSSSQGLSIVDVGSYEIHSLPLAALRQPKCPVSGLCLFSGGYGVLSRSVFFSLSPTHERDVFECAERGRCVSACPTVAVVGTSEFITIVRPFDEPFDVHFGDCYGPINSVAIDPTGSRIALVFNESESVLLLSVDTDSLLPLGWVSGPGKSVAVGFSADCNYGAILSVVWRCEPDVLSDASSLMTTLLPLFFQHD